MLDEEKSQLIKLGNNLAITIPKSWIDYWELKKDEKLHVLYYSVFVIIPLLHLKEKQLVRIIKEVIVI